jgi:hypothetical protein
MRNKFPNWSIIVLGCSIWLYYSTLYESLGITQMEHSRGFWYAKDF